MSSTIGGLTYCFGSSCDVSPALDASHLLNALGTYSNLATTNLAESATMLSCIPGRFWMPQVRFVYPAKRLPCAPMIMTLTI